MSSDEVTPVMRLLQDVVRIREAVGRDPAPDSPADIDLRSFERRESVSTIYSQASVIVESAADHLEALDLLVATRELAVAPWVTARAALEASALVIWLLDSDIDVKERVGRSLALRYEALRSQEKLARAAKEERGLSSVRERMDGVEKIAVRLGFKPLKDGKGTRTGIGLPKPSNTELVEKLVGDQKLYRILCGVAHADYVTLQQLSFMRVEAAKAGGTTVMRAIPPELQMHLLVRTAAAHARAAWLVMVRYGCDAAEAAVALEACFNQLDLPDTDAVRFWRVTPSAGI